MHTYKREKRLAGEGATASNKFVDIEKIAKIQGAHHSAADQDLAYIRKLEME